MMIPWMQIYDNNNYGKWLVEFWLEISTLPDEINVYMKDGLFAQSMTGKPYTCLPLDLWIEMTMNKGSKMKAGWKNILKNETMLVCHTRTANFVNRIRVSLHKVANLKSSTSEQHRENTRMRLKYDELAVQDLENCIAEFNCNPFDPINSNLRTLQSGEVASLQLAEDFKTALHDGEKLFQTFLKDRMFSRNKLFDAVMHKNSRKSFSNPPRDRKTAAITPSTSVAMENKAMSEVIVLCSEKNVSLVSVMEYRVTEECLSLFNTNGTMVKVQKSKLIEQLCFTPLPYDKLTNSISLIDMGFIWRLSTPSSEDREKNDETNFTWRDYAIKMFNLIKKRHSVAQTIILVNDPYDIDITVKDSEHDRRATSKFQGGRKNVFIRPNDSLPKSQGFNDFFRNKANKIRLQQFHKTEFSILCSNEAQNVLYSIQSYCIDLQTGQRREEFECRHMEADTILFYIYCQLRKSKITETVVIDAEDTDVVVLAARVSHQIEGVLGIKRKQIVFDCSKLCTEETSRIIVQLHVATGADSISGFFGHGKKSVMQNALKSKDAHSLLKGIL